MVDRRIPDGGKPTPAEAWSGFLEPEADLSLSERARRVYDAPQEYDTSAGSILRYLVDGDPHLSHEVLAAVGTPVLEFAEGVRSLRRAKLISVRREGDKEYLRITPDGSSLLKLSD